MGQLVFQANSGGQTNLVGQNTASTFNLNIPLANGTLVSTGDTATVTSTMIFGPITTAKGGTGLMSFTSGGAVYATSTSALTTGTLPTSAGGTNLTSFTANGVVYASSTSALATGSALTFDGTNLGIGVLNTNALLTINGDKTALRIERGSAIGFAYNTGTTATSSFRLQSNSGPVDIYTAVGQPITFSAEASEQMRLTTTGLGIGTSSFSARLAVSAAKATVQITSTTGTNGAYQAFTNTGGNFYIGLDSSTGGDFAAAYAGVMWHGGAYPLLFGTSNTERARIDSSGNLLVGTTDNSTNQQGYAWNINSGGSFGRIGHANGTASGTAYLAFQYNGGVIGTITQSGTTAVLYNVTSDQRLKENIVDAPDFGSVIDSIKVRSYDWKADGNHQRAGFIAQELVTVAPEAVHQPADPEEMMAVDYSKLVPMLVKEIQSLRARLKAANIA